jgi:hypothetical protein
MDTAKQQKDANSVIEKNESQMAQVAKVLGFMQQ